MYTCLYIYLFTTLEGYLQIASNSMHVYTLTFEYLIELHVDNKFFLLVRDAIFFFINVERKK